MNRLKALLIAGAVLLGLMLVAPGAANAAAIGSDVVVGNTYQDVNLTGVRTHLDILPWKGNCDASGYLIPVRYHTDFTRMSSISLGNAANDWTILGCKYLTLYVYDSNSHLVTVVPKHHGPIMNFGIWDNDVRAVRVSG